MTVAIDYADTFANGWRAAAFDETFPVPEPYPASWFDKPDWLQPGQGHTVLASGQCAGYWYPRGACIVGNEQACPTPSPTGYAAFKQGTTTVVVGDGDAQVTKQIEVGVIGQVGGHASPYSSTQQASEHYNNPEKQRIVCVLGDDEHGGWYAGGLVPGLTRRQVEEVRRCSLSGDWRPMPRDWWERNGVSPQDVAAAQGYDSLGPTLVTRPALPMVRAFPRAASVPSHVDGVPAFEYEARPVMLGGTGGIQLPDDDGQHQGWGMVARAEDENAYDPLAHELATADDVPCSDCQETGMTASATDEKPKADEPQPELTDEQKAEVAEIVQGIIERDNAEREKRAKAKAAKERVAAIEPVELPAPDGFDERTIHLTTADLEHIERQAIQAAPTAPPSPRSAPDRPAAQRRRDESTGVSRPGGGYPIRNCADAMNARRAIGRAAPGERPAVMRHIANRERALGCDNGPMPGSNG